MDWIHRARENPPAVLPDLYRPFNEFMTVSSSVSDSGHGSEELAHVHRLLKVEVTFFFAKSNFRAN
jgi:hypothetical protein